MSTSLTGKVVAVTGAAQGIGAATAQALVDAGAAVAIGDIDLATAKGTADRIGRGTIAVRLDVSDPASYDAFLDEVERTLGPIDVLVNNAGIMPLSAVLDETDELQQRIFDINTHAMIRGTREAVRRMLPRGRGHVVNVASTAGKGGLAGGALYCASKAAVIVYTQGAAAELRGTGLEFSVVMPGIVRTHLADGVEENRALTAIQPEDVAAAIVDAVAAPRLEVYVPKSYGRMIKSVGILPERAGAWIARRLKADRVFLDAARRPERKAYEDRARGE